MTDHVSEDPPFVVPGMLNLSDNVSAAADDAHDGDAPDVPAPAKRVRTQPATTRALLLPAPLNGTPKTVRFFSIKDSPAFHNDDGPNIFTGYPEAALYIYGGHAASPVPGFCGCPPPTTSNLFTSGAPNADVERVLQRTHRYVVKDGDGLEYEERSELGPGASCVPLPTCRQWLTIRPALGALAYCENESCAYHHIGAAPPAALAQQLELLACEAMGMQHPFIDVLTNPYVVVTDSLEATVTLIQRLIPTHGTPSAIGHASVAQLYTHFYGMACPRLPTVSLLDSNRVVGGGLFAFNERSGGWGLAECGSNKLGLQLEASLWTALLVAYDKFRCGGVGVKLAAAITAYKRIFSTPQVLQNLRATVDFADLENLYHTQPTGEIHLHGRTISIAAEVVEVRETRRRDLVIGVGNAVLTEPDYEYIVTRVNQGDVPAEGNQPWEYVDHGLARAFIKSLWPEDELCTMYLLTVLLGIADGTLKQKVLVLYGPTRCGKNTLLDFLSAVVPTCQLLQSDLTRGGDANTALIRACWTRLIKFGECGRVEGRLRGPDSLTLNELTGGASKFARGAYEKFGLSFVPTGNVVIEMNDLTPFEGAAATIGAVEARVVPIAFAHGHPGAELPYKANAAKREFVRDMLVMMLRCKKYQRPDGLPVFPMPERFKAALAKLCPKFQSGSIVATTAEDAFSEFVLKRTEPAPRVDGQRRTWPLSMAVSSWQEAFSAWCAAKAYPPWQLTKPMFEVKSMSVMRKSVGRLGVAPKQMPVVVDYIFLPPSKPDVGSVPVELSQVAHAGDEDEMDG